MPCQFPNTMHWTCNLPSHLSCHDFHRSTYVGIILQVYKINYMSHMPEQKTRHPLESIWHHNQPHDLYSHTVHIQPTFPSCYWYSSKYRIAGCEQACTDAEFTTYEAVLVRCWQLCKIHNHITSSHNLKAQYPYHKTTYKKSARSLTETVK
jgi:hypothetical protein